MIQVTKFQRHPSNPASVILHISCPWASEGFTQEVVHQPYRDALEAAGKLED